MMSLRQTRRRLRLCSNSENLYSCFWTYVLFFWLNFCDENHIERIRIAVKNINLPFHLASEIMKADRLHLFLLSNGTRIDEDEYLSSLEDGTELIVCTENKSKNCRSILNWKHILSLKNISYPLNIILYDAWLHFGWLRFQNNFDEYFLSSFVEAILSSTFYQVLFKVFL